MTLVVSALTVHPRPYSKIGNECLEDVCWFLCVYSLPSKQENLLAPYWQKPGRHRIPIKVAVVISDGFPQMDAH